MARLKPVDFDERLTLVEHLDELRSRLIVSAVVLVVAVILCFWQNHLLLEIANGPLPAGFEPITFSPGEPFITTLTIAVYGALLISLPVILFQLYSFVVPALTPREKRRRLWTGALPTADMPSTRVGERRAARAGKRALTVTGIELTESNVGYDPYDRGSNLR